MKYFIDTEFIEGFHKPILGKRRHFIDLISIGIVCEDGREYYAISNEFNSKDADSWVKGNVISKLPRNHFSIFDSPRIRSEAMLWKNNSMIANDIQGFVYVGGVDIEHEFYGYYSDYDWVLLCSLFGRMIDLPKGFPMYCKDLKQMFDEKAETFTSNQLTDFQYGEGYMSHDVYDPLNYMKVDYNKATILKKHKKYPKQENEHNALADAKWNYELYKFLNTNFKPQQVEP